MYTYTLSSKFKVVHLFYYHIKTTSLWSNYWKSTKAKKKKKKEKKSTFATFKKYTLSQWFCLFDYKVIF